MAEKRYYWLKLKEGFFGQDEILILSGMPNGTDYVLLYLHLLCMAVGRDGALRYSPEIPYTEQMLAAVTQTNIDVVRGALTAFKALGLLEIQADGTLFFTKIADMVGSESASAHRVREYRERQEKALPALPENTAPLHCNADVTGCNADVTQENRDKSIDTHSFILPRACAHEESGEKDDFEELEAVDPDEMSAEEYAATLEHLRTLNRRKGRLMLSDKQFEALCDNLSSEEVEHYIGVLRECVDNGHRPRNPYAFIMRMARADRSVKT